MNGRERQRVTASVGEGADRAFGISVRPGWPREAVELAAEEQHISAHLVHSPEPTVVPEGETGKKFGRSEAMRGASWRRRKSAKHRLLIDVDVLRERCGSNRELAPGAERVRNSDATWRRGVAGANGDCGRPTKLAPPHIAGRRCKAGCLLLQSDTARPHKHEGILTVNSQKFRTSFLTEIIPPCCVVTMSRLRQRETGALRVNLRFLSQ
jgi:hypothetical protein